MPPRHVVVRPHLWPRGDMVWGPQASLTIVLRPIYTPLTQKTLKQSIIFHEKFHRAATIETKFRGSEGHVPAPCRDGD